MADSSAPIELRAFLTSLIEQLDSLNEEGLLTVYYQLQNYPELGRFVQQYEGQIITAIQHRDAPMIAGLLRKIEADFTINLAQEVIQVSTQKERALPEYVLDPDELRTRSRGALAAIEDVGPISQNIHRSHKETSRAFISRLVDNYKERLSAEQRSALVDAISKEAELQPSAPAKQILQTAINETLAADSTVAPLILTNQELANRVIKLQLYDSEVVAEQIARVFIESPSPQVARAAILEGLKTTAGTASSIDTLLERAELVSTASAIINSSTDATPDYRGFFSALAQNGNTIDRAVAPVGDVILAVFPRARETIVTSVMGSLWKKESADGGIVQKTLGSLFNSEAVAQMIRKGNAVFSTSSTGHILTPAQSALGDIITTVLHPTVTTVWVEIAQVNGALLPSGIYQYYLSLLARKGAKEGTKAAAKKLGKEVAKKITSKSVGQAVGGTLGSFLMGLGIPPGVAQAIGAWLGGQLFEKIGGLFGKTIGFVKGLLNYVGEPWFKDYGLVLGLILIAILIIPILFPFFGGAGYTQVVTDNAFVAGFGYEGENGPFINCLAEENKTNPLCSMEACDPAKQDCRWPARGFIYQGPNSNTSCPGTHTGNQAIDIDPVGGETGIDVYSTVEGVVEDAFWGCPDGSGHMGNQCGAMRGNYVIVRGASYTLTFYHLSQLVTPVQTGDQVHATTVIGKMDQTGNSSGTHLHFGYRGPGSINSILPIAVPTCNNYHPNCVCPYILTY